MKQKKGQFPIVKAFLIILISIAIVSSMAYMIIKTKSLPTDERKVNIQLATKQILSCFSQEYGKINSEELTQEKLDNCLATKENLLIKIKLYNGAESKEFVGFSKESEFSSKKNFCNVQNSNILCTYQLFPIIFTNEVKNKVKVKELEVQAISY